MSWHYEEYQIESSTMYVLSFQNAETKQNIRVYLPTRGIFHNARQKTTLKHAKKIASELRKVFKRILD